MKTTNILMMLCSFVITIAACEKNVSSRLGTIKTSKSELKIGDSLGVHLQNIPGGAVARWSVEPSAGTSMDSLYSTGWNVIAFNQPGTYIITAEIRIVPSNCTPSPGHDTCFNNATIAQRLSSTVIARN
ncbi:MAG: hypothetical protein JWN76_3525 [Chitinophagaceae bacterium]|nr:hypothetical protein [Chitinophagaceae bacterium]